MEFCKKILKILIFLMFSIFYCFFSCAYSNPFGIDFAIESDSIYFVNLDTNTLILEKEKNLKIPCSALAKIMTTILVLESNECKKNPKKFLQKKITATSDIFDRLYLKGASNADLKKGEIISVKDALFATMLQSACEAAVMLSKTVSGNDMESFVEKMNNKAKELKMENTFFTDPDGLDTINQYTTAYDMFILTKYCLKNPMFRKIATSKTYEIPPTNIHKNPIKLLHTNKMLNKFQGGKNFDERVNGIKTAKLEDKASLISIAQQNSYNYLLIVLGAPIKKDSNIIFSETKKLYDWAFKNLKLELIATPGEKTIPHKIKVNLKNNKDELFLTPKEQITLLIPTSVDKSAVFWDTSNLPKQINAPIKKGTKIGTVFLKLSDATVKEVEVVALKNVNANILGLLSHILIKTITSAWFIAILILTIILIILIYFNRKTSKKKFRKKKVRKYKSFR